MKKNIVYQLLETNLKKGTTEIILETHSNEIIENYCNRINLLNKVKDDLGIEKLKKWYSMQIVIEQ